MLCLKKKLRTFKTVILATWKGLFRTRYKRPWKLLIEYKKFNTTKLKFLLENIVHALIVKSRSVVATLVCQSSRIGGEIGKCPTFRLF